MGETGIIVRFPGGTTTLDPTAQEFTPTTNHTIPLTLPLPLPLPLPVAVAVGVPYPHFAAAEADVTSPVQLSTSPTRSLLLTPVPLTSESALRSDLEVFGDVRAVQMEALHHGIVTVHFYDLRHAQNAFTAIRTHHMHCASFFNSPPQFYPAPPPPLVGLVAGRPVWAHYVIPASNALLNGHNQGTLVVFNLDMDVSAENLQRVFEPFGPIKEVRDTPWKKNQRFVEFFDIRDAAKALIQMNGKEIHGKPVIIQFSRPGGHTRKFLHSKKPHLNLNNIPPLLSPPPRFSPSPRRRFAEPHFSHKKFTVKIANSGSIAAASMGSMSLSGEVGNANGVDDRHLHGPPKRNVIRKHSSETTMENTKQQQPQLPRSRHWKGKHARKHETRFLIKENAIVESGSKDSRTTVMIKNIPNKYSQKLLLNMLDNHCIHCNEQIGDSDEQPISSYDFVYLPIDFNNKCNVGYGFVNMTSPEATVRLYKAFHLQHWEVFNSRKICEVTYARVQGLEALKEHFKNSKFPCEMEHYMPVVFSPPRDGRELTEPLPIVGIKQQQQMAIIPIGVVPSCGDEMESGDRLGDSDSDNVSSSKSGGVGDDDTNEQVGGDLLLLQLQLNTSDDTKV